MLVTYGIAVVFFFILAASIAGSGTKGKTDPNELVVAQQKANADFYSIFYVSVSKCVYMHTAAYMILI